MQDEPEPEPQIVELKLKKAIYDHIRSEQRKLFLLGDTEKHKNILAPLIGKYDRDLVVEIRHGNSKRRYYVAEVMKCRAVLPRWIEDVYWRKYFCVKFALGSDGKPIEYED